MEYQLYIFNDEKTISLNLFGSKLWPACRNSTTTKAFKAKSSKIMFFSFVCFKSLNDEDII